MNKLAIFDIDGTLTDTNGVDDECFCLTIADALGLAPSAIDWTGAAHVTDAEIFRHVCEVHGRREPSVDEMSRARELFVKRLSVEIDRAPLRFASIGGAVAMLAQLEERGWSVAVATGGWGPSARLKLNKAGLSIDDAVFACADDARSRADIVQLARTRAEAFYRRQFDRVVSIGDGVWDVTTAIELDLPFVGIASGNRAERLRDAGANAVLEDYSDPEAFWSMLETATTPRRRSSRA